MSDFSGFDGECMARALRLAARGAYTAHPNPMVGCVLARDGRIVGEGWHRLAGDAHAEVNAISDAGDARGATAYVSLEPCNHEGRTPPCTQALIDAGVSEVVFALEDPFAGAAGEAAKKLRAAGIAVRSGLMASDAETQNRGFLSRIQRGRPFVRVKIAASLDGAIAMKNGESQWITGPAARTDVQKLRAGSGAILSGIGTVLADDPSLNVRDATIDTAGRQPLRVIVDSSLRMPLSSGMLCLPGNTLVFCVNDDGRAALEAAGAEVIRTAGDNSDVDLEQVLEELGSRGVNDLLVEAGPSLSGNLLAVGLVDELIIYQAPQIMGSETIGMFSTPAWTALRDRRMLTIVESQRLGVDTRITARILQAD